MAGFGLKLLRSVGPDGFTGNQIEFDISPSNTGAIYAGDLVRLNAGFLVEATGATNNNDFSPLGVFLGCRYVDSSGSFKFKRFWDGVAGRTNIKAMVAVPEGATFLIKGTAGATYTQANTIGARFGVNYTAGSSVYGDSRVRLGSTAAASTGPLLVHRLVDAPRNSFTATEPLFEVVFARKQGFPALA